MGPHQVPNNQQKRTEPVSGYVFDPVDKKATATVEPIVPRAPLPSSFIAIRLTFG